jgi:hypothetical protein
MSIDTRPTWLLGVAEPVVAIREGFFTSCLEMTEAVEIGI